MNFIVHYSKGKVSGYVRSRDGTWSFHDDPRLADRYDTAEDASHSGKVGHHSDMGGSGFKGRVVPYDTALADFEARNEGLF